MKRLRKKITRAKKNLISYAETVAIMTRQFEDKVRELSTIRRIGDALAHALEVENVCNRILEAVMEGMGAERGMLVLFESSSRTPLTRVCLPKETPTLRSGIFPPEEMIESVMKEKRPLVRQDVSEAQLILGVGVPEAGSTLTLPLICRDREVGVLHLAHLEPNGFQADQILAGHIIASQAAIALENVKFLHEVLRLNMRLEEKVLERTRSLQEANMRLIEIQDQLIQAEKMKAIGQLTAGIGHNLKTPLSVIMSAAELINLHSNGNEKIGQYVHKIVEQSTRMSGIIENMMEKSHKAQRREQEELDINRILRAELDFMEGNLDFKHNIAKDYHFDSNLPRIRGFYGDFGQTFMNLINNAIDAMYKSEKRRLRVCTRYDNGCIYVDIEDTGCGILEENRERIFEFAFTTKPSVSQDGAPSGTGIGLFNSRQLMSKYGAEINVKSRPGETTFTVQIPRLERGLVTA